MKPILRLITLCFFLNTTNISAQDYFGEFSKTEFNCDGEDLNFFLWLFENKTQITNFLDIKKGDKVVEIGAGNGINFGVMSMLYDSVNFTAQDINETALNRISLNKLIRKYTKYSGKPQTNTFEIVIGNLTSTHLKDNTYDEAFIINSLHDFDKQEEMIDDIGKKIKQDGKFILLEGYSFPGDTQTCPDYGPHVLHTLDFELARFEKHGWYLTKMRAPNFKAAHYGQALIYERDKNKSLAFYTKKKNVDEVISHAFRFRDNVVASDAALMLQITDSLKPRIRDINQAYTGFETWLRELGYKHMMKAEYQAAENIFKSIIDLYPTSYQTYYWLAYAQEKQSKFELALKNYSDALAKSPNNEACIKKVKQMEKLSNGKN